MKLETIVGIVMLLAFAAFVTFGGQLAQQIVFMFGCFAIGWNIPDAAKSITKSFAKKEIA